MPTDSLPVTVFVTVLVPFAVIFCALAFWSFARLRTLEVQRRREINESDGNDAWRQKERLDVGPKPRLHEIWTMVEDIPDEQVMTKKVGPVKSLGETKPIMCTPKSSSSLQVCTLVCMPTASNEVQRAPEPIGPSETVLASASVALRLTESLGGLSG